MTTGLTSVLVAGGAGYIGSHTAKALRQAGFAPVVLDNLSAGYREAVRYGPFYEGDIADGSLVKRIAEEHRPAGAILFAGFIAVGESVGNPRKYFGNNVTNATSFLNSLLDYGMPRLVFSSSCAVYGFQERAPIREDSSTEPVSPYAETKLIFENVLKWYAGAYPLKYAALRYFNAAGADPEGEIGERHEPETHLIPLAIHAATGGPPLRVFGNDYPTPDGTPLRDYIHVTDLADAHVRALRRLMEGGDNLVVNLGTGRGYSVHEVIRAVESVSGRKVPVVQAPRREGDATALVADPEMSRKMLEWEPRHSSLEEIVRTAWEWHKRIAGVL